MDRSSVKRIQDLIERGTIQHNVGDEVTILYRKSNGYPRLIKDGVVYQIISLLPDGHIVVKMKSDANEQIGWGPREIKIHRKYVINISTLRHFKLNSILGETN